VKTNEFPLILIEGVSVFLFIEDDLELVKEFESVLKRLSMTSTVVVTCNVNSEGTVISNYLWTDVISNNLFLTHSKNEITATHYKYSISQTSFPSIH
jgi:hypothetical protein